MLAGAAMLAPALFVVGTTVRRTLSATPDPEIRRSSPAPSRLEAPVVANAECLPPGVRVSTRGGNTRQGQWTQ